MKKIIILLIGIVLAFNAMSCRVDNDDLIEKIIILENIKSSENTETEGEESPKLDEPSETEEGEEIEEPKDEDDVDESKDDSEKEDEESPKLDEPSENTETNEDTEIEEPKDEDDVDESKDDSEKEDEENNIVVENITWYEIDENTNILELNYIAHYEDSTAIFNSDSNDAEIVKTTPFTMRCNVSSSNGTFREIVITVKYNEGKLNFSISNQSPYYTIKNVNYSESTSTIHIYILHK